MEIKGYVNSIQTLGAADGPGVRFIAFMQGCPLRCACCHNPDTWEFSVGKQYTPQEIADKVVRYKEYFGEMGGITVSGGEPLCQPQFIAELFKLCRAEGINTCLDTSGCILNEDIKTLLSYTDLVLLDIKYTSDADYLKNVGCSLNPVLEFLSYLNEQGINTWLRQVIIPNLNDNEDNILKLKQIAERYPCVKKTELLPFKKLCLSKYENLKMEFPLKETPEPTTQKMNKLNSLLK